MYKFKEIQDGNLARKQSELSKLFVHEFMGEIALEWTDLIRSSIERRHRLVIFEVYRNTEFIGIAILLLVKKLKMTQWKPAAPFFRFFGSVDVGFIEIPLANMSGILTRKDIKNNERENIVNALCDYIRRTIYIDVLFIKTNNSVDQCNEPLLLHNMLSLPFYPNTLLKYPYTSFDEYLSGITRKKYRRCLSDRKKMKDGKGRIEIVHEISTVHEEIYALYRKTSEQAKKKQNYIEMPVQINKKFFQNIDGFEGLQPCVATVVVEGKIIAYCLLLQSGRTLFVKSVGLDYCSSYQTKAYFNLFYAALEYAGRQQCNKVDFGITGYQFKQWLGCELIPTAYLCRSFNPIISFLSKPLSFFAERIIRSDMPDQSKPLCIGRKK